jgi:plastocyanin
MKTRFASFLITACFAPFVFAGSFVGTATDRDGQPLPNVVFSLKPITAGITMPTTPAATASITQEGLVFKPMVTAIRVGSMVQFPNRDSVEHHIKSFSAVKPFEIAVHKPGAAPAPIRFDQSGAVIVYCILHDWMRAFVYVADTPWFSQTTELGAARIADLPGADYEVSAWHPDLGQFKPPLTQKITIPGTGSVTSNFSFDFKPKTLRRPKPTNISGGDHSSHMAHSNHK